MRCRFSRWRTPYRCRKRLSSQFPQYRNAVGDSRTADIERHADVCLLGRNADGFINKLLEDQGVHGGAGCAHGVPLRLKATGQIYRNLVVAREAAVEVIVAAAAILGQPERLSRQY